MIKMDDVLEGVKSVAIAGHIRPDGDCVGSCLGIYNYIRNNYPRIEVTVYLELVPNSFRFLSGAEQVKHQVDTEKKYDLFLALDCGDARRLGDAEIFLQTAARTICIDHHISNSGYAHENHIVPDASSTSELVYLSMNEDKVDLKTAEALYLGIVHDTGVFQYTCTSERTMQIAGQLMSKGVAYTNIIEQTFFEKTYAQNQILGRALLESMRIMDSRCIFTAIKKATMDFYQVVPKDLEGIVNQLRMTKGVECAILLYETEPHIFKVSLRSKEKVDVSKVAAVFGGGGHVRAAGCTMSGTVHDVINNLTCYIEEQI